MLSHLIISLFILSSPKFLFSNNTPDKKKGPTVEAVRINTPPVVDGIVLSDPAYSSSSVISDFQQKTPAEGNPASEQTEVRIVYTNDTLYVGVVCYDKEPNRIVISESQRDASLDNSDSFQMIFDTFYDRQNGFLFGTNPAGIEYDAQITNEGELSALARRSGSTGGFNLNWDGSWKVRTHIGDYGWSAEFAIPFRTLRYSGGTQQNWGSTFNETLEGKTKSVFGHRFPVSSVFSEFHYPEILQD